MAVAPIECISAFGGREGFEVCACRRELHDGDLPLRLR